MSLCLFVLCLMGGDYAVTISTRIFSKDYAQINMVSLQSTSLLGM
jgi:hypothetical protein